ncbi:MAG: hypothetical protein M3Y84_03560, partial [Acidobacteriota bacterium]|nr:hypothetical protein [Acidobacteriota bacterium]
MKDAGIEAKRDTSGFTAHVSLATALGGYEAPVRDPGDYIALLAYVEETPEIEAVLQAIRMT